jgi:hypothetical protein
MINKISKIVLAATSVFLPVISFAQLATTDALLTKILDMIRVTLIPLAFSLALLFFFWGMAKYIRKSGDEKEEGRKIMVWGVIALFVMSSIWGLVFFIRNEIGTDLNTTNMKIPDISR